MNVSVMWGTKKFEVNLHSDKPISAFMEDLQKLTGVPVARQKLMMRRKQLKPEDLWDANEVKAGTRFMLIGTAELPPEPLTAEAEEDEPEIIEEGGLSSKEYSLVAVGLTNFGNTCYLNACLQTFRLIPELCELIKNANVDAGQGANNITRALSNLYRNFPQALMTTVATLRNQYPILFDQRDEAGAPKQQDATEAWTYLMNCLKSTVGKPIRDLFEIGFKVTKSCPELNNKTEETVEFEDRLNVYINEEVRQIEQGINMDTEVEIEEKSVGHPVIWQSHRAITKLPKYLICQMLRFTYKKDEQITAKLVRRVAHPMRLDTLQWLAPELRQEIVKKREELIQEKENNGFYRLKGVLTHRGRSADSGHYITHMRVNETWFRFDDTKVTEVDEEAIEMLSGSGDWHCSILLLYEAE